MSFEASQDRLKRSPKPGVGGSSPPGGTPDRPEGTLSNCRPAAGIRGHRCGSSLDVRQSPLWIEPCADAPADRGEGCDVATGKGVKDKLAHGADVTRDCGADAAARRARTRRPVRRAPPRRNGATGATADRPSPATYGEDRTRLVDRKRAAGRESRGRRGHEPPDRTSLVRHHSHCRSASHQRLPKAEHRQSRSARNRSYTTAVVACLTAADLRAYVTRPSAGQPARSWTGRTRAASARQCSRCGRSGCPAQGGRAGTGSTRRLQLRSGYSGRTHST